MPSRSPLKIEHILYVAIILLAAGIRFAVLGEIPLNEYEAQAALNAQHLASGSASSVGDQPGYVLLTSIIFSLLPSSEFLARLWPVIFGIALVALPFFWRDLLGRKTALVLSLALALDPGFVSISRLASGRMIAIGALLIGLTLWRERKTLVAGVFFALALLAAPTVYLGALGIAIVSALFFAKSIRISKSELRSGLTSAAATLIVGSVFFFGSSDGIGAIGNVLTSFLSGWAVTTQTHVFEVLFALIAYGLPAVLFGLIRAARAWTQPGDTLSRTLSLAMLANLSLVLLYPGHEVADLLWVLLPLWTLAAIEISTYLFVPKEDQRAAFGEAGLMALLLFFLLFTFAKLSTTEINPVAGQAYLILALGVLMLGTLATLLIAFGWSRKAAANGLVWAVSLFFVLILVSDSARFLRNDQYSANDLWWPGPGAGEMFLIEHSVENLSNWSTGQPADLSVDLRVESAALAWAFRNLPTQSGSVPELVVTLANEAQPSEISYRGQSFAYEMTRSWENVPPNLFSWLLYRKIPVVTDQAILWASLELFPDAASQFPNPENPSN